MSTQPLPGPSVSGLPADDRSVPWRGVRVRTVVLGLVALAVSVSVLLATLTDVQVDGTAVTLTVMLLAGAALLAGGLAAARREARGGPGA